MIKFHPLILVLSVFGGILITALFNYGILDPLFIPDPCYYHSHKKGALVSLFYTFSSGDGFHPFPSVLNFVLTALIGGFLGYTTSVYFFTHLKKKKASCQVNHEG